MAEINFLDYANTPAAMATALSDLIGEGGGTLNVDRGTDEIVLDDTITFGSSGNKVPVHIRGNGGTRIRLAGGNSKVIFNAGDLVQLTYEKLTVLGDDGDDFHCLKAFVSGIVDAGTKFIDCNFFGVSAMDSIIECGPLPTYIDDNYFHGCRAGDLVTPNSAIIHGGSSFGGLRTRGLKVRDHGQLGAGSYSKVGNKYWIWIENGLGPYANDFIAPYVYMVDTHFDENAHTGIRLENIASVYLHTWRYNHPSWSGAHALELVNSRGEMIGSHFGYGTATNDVLATEGSVLTVDNLTREDGVGGGSRDASSWIEPRNCVLPVAVI